jgi:hypothetical protein
MKTLAKTALTATLGLAMAFTFSCSSDKDDEGITFNFNVNSQTYHEHDNGAPYTRSGDIKTGDESNNLGLNVGNVTNGIVSRLELPPTIPEEYLNDKIWCKTSPQDAKYSIGLKLIVDGKWVGSLVPSLDNDWAYFILLLYSSKDVKITCDNEYHAKAGWNKVYVRKTYDCYDRSDPSCDQSHHFLYANDTLAKEKEMKWWIDK